MEKLKLYFYITWIATSLGTISSQNPTYQFSEDTYCLSAYHVSTNESNIRVLVSPNPQFSSYYKEYVYRFTLPDGTHRQRRTNYPIGSESTHYGEGEYKCRVTILYLTQNYNVVFFDQSPLMSVTVENCVRNDAHEMLNSVIH